MIIMDFYRRRPRHRAARPTIFTLKLLTVCSCDKELESDSWLFRTKCFKSTYDLVNEYKARKKLNLCASIHDTELNETVLTEYLFMSFFLFSFLSPPFSHWIPIHRVRGAYFWIGKHQCDASYAKNINKTQVKSTNSIKNDGQQNKSDNKFNGMQNISIRVERATTANGADHHHESPNHLRPPHLFSTANTT